MTLHIVGGFGLGRCETYPGMFGPFAGFAADTPVLNGYLKLPDRRGRVRGADGPVRDPAPPDRRRMTPGQRRGVNFGTVVD